MKTLKLFPKLLLLGFLSTIYSCKKDSFKPVTSVSTSNHPAKDGPIPSYNFN